MKKIDFKNVNFGTWIRTIGLIIALVNQVLVMNGKSILPFSSEDIEMWVTSVITIVMSILTWWKNNSFSEQAQIADQFLEDLSETIKSDEKETKIEL